MVALFAYIGSLIGNATGISISDLMSLGVQTAAIFGVVLISCRSISKINIII